MNIFRRLRAIEKSSLFMNAMYLMLSTAVLGASGFVFWMLITHMYNATEVGVATTLLSVSGLVSLLGLVGFDTAFVRFLPNSKHKNDYINGGFTVVTFASAAIAVCIGAALPFVSPDLSLLSSNWAFVAFVFFTIISSLNVLVGAIFLAYKRARFILLISVLLGAFKIIMPLIVARGSAMTIFLIVGAAQLIGLLFGLAWLKRKFGFSFSVLFDSNVLREVRKFSFSAYMSSVLNLLPPTLLPLIII